MYVGRCSRIELGFTATAMRCGAANAALPRRAAHPGRAALAAAQRRALAVQLPVGADVSFMT